MITYKRCDQVEDELIYETFKEGFSDYIIKIEMNFEDFIKRFFNIDGNDRAHSYIALDNGVGVGVIFGGINTFDGEKSIRCGALCILPEYRGKGVAQELLKLHKLAALEQNCSQVVLEVIVGNNRAIRFYEKNDYVKKYNWYIYSTDDFSFLENIKNKNIKPITNQELKDYRYKYVDYHIAWDNEIFSVEKRDAQHYAIFKNNEIAGAISMQGDSILFLHVQKKYRGKGCGKALIKKALTKDTAKISTFFSAQNDLEQFLVKNNFVKDKLAQYEMTLKL